MALLTFEGFDYLSTSPGADLATNPAFSGSNINSKSSGGPYGTGFSVSATSAQVMVSYAYPSTLATVVVGFHFAVPNTIGSIAYDFLRVMDGSSVQVGLGITTAGKLFIYRGTSATVIATGTTTLLASTWYMIELKVTINNSGTYEVRIDTATELSGSADTQNTANAQTTSVRFGHFVGSGNSGFFDDFYVCDTTGSAPNNDFLGNVRVETSFVTSNNSVTWTPLSSTNASNVDETNSDGDTTYNSSPNSGDIDTFNHGSLVSSPNTIFGVLVVSKIRKDDAVARSARNKMISGATTSDGGTLAMATTYQYLRDIYELDPNTSAAWTVSNVDATKIGYEYI